MKCNDPAIREQLGMKYAPRARVSANTSKSGTVYLALRDNRASGSVFRNRDGGFILATTFGRGRSPLPTTIKASKKSVVFTIEYPFQNDTEFATVKDFLEGKIKAAPQATVSTDDSTDETVSSDTTETTPTPAAKPTAGKQDAKAIMAQANALVTGGLYPDVNTALAAHKSGEW